MKRRAGSILLIVSLLGGIPCRASESAASARARVWAKGSDPARTHALCQAVAATGARVRVVRTGDNALLAVSATTPAQLRRALDALGRRADAANVKIRVTLTDSAEQAKAVSARGISLDTPRPAAVSLVAAVERAGGLAMIAPSWRGAAPPDLPACCPASQVGGWGLRGPPA